MNDDIHWEDPPADIRTTRFRLHMRYFAEELQRHPGKWALYVNRNGKEWHGPATKGALEGYGLETISSSLDRPPGVSVNNIRLWARLPEA